MKLCWRTQSHSTLSRCNLVSRRLWPRRLTYAGLHSEPVYPTRGIAAGAALATFEFIACVVKAIQEISVIPSSLTVSLPVDDLALAVTVQDEILFETMRAPPLRARADRAPLTYPPFGRPHMRPLPTDPRSDCGTGLPLLMGPLQTFIRIRTLHSSW